jgi:hypothetical protein
MAWMKERFFTTQMMENSIISLLAIIVRNADSRTLLRMDANIPILFMILTVLMEAVATRL